MMARESMVVKTMSIPIKVTFSLHLTRKRGKLIPQVMWCWSCHYTINKKKKKSRNFRGSPMFRTLEMKVKIKLNDTRRTYLEG